MNMNVREILENITKEHASDIFVVAGRPLTYKVSGKMHTYQEERMKPDMCRDFVTAIYELADHINGKCLGFNNFLPISRQNNTIRLQTA